MSKVKKILIGLIIIALIAAIVLLVINIVMAKVDNKPNPVVTMEVEGYGIIKMELYPDKAPNTVKNFIKLAQNGFYNGKTFNDIENGLVRAGAVAETTDEDGNAVTGPMLSDMKTLAEGEEDYQYAIPGEFMENNYTDNNLKHQRGVISMYRKTSSLYQQEISLMQMMGYSEYIDPILEDMYDSQDTQFFILTADNMNYNGLFSAFGRVTEGMDIVDQISQLELTQETDENGESYESTKPVNPPVIKNVTVETYGVNYGDPEVVRAIDFDAYFDMFMQMFNQSSNYSY